MFPRHSISPSEALSETVDPNTFFTASHTSIRADKQSRLLKRSGKAWLLQTLWSEQLLYRVPAQSFTSHRGTRAIVTDAQPTRDNQLHSASFLRAVRHLWRLQ